MQQTKKYLITLGFILIISVSLNALFIYDIYTKQKQISESILNLQENSEIKFEEIMKSIDLTKEEINFLEKEINLLEQEMGSIGEEFSVLKASTSADFSGIIEDVVKSVVTIKTDVSQGTGFIITEDGYVVTNAHVLSGGKTIQTITHDKKKHEAKFIGYDGQFDLALIKIEGDYRKIKLADSDDIKIGEKVIAIGNPLGLQFSVSEGIVSGIHRIGANEENAYIQTDTALNPGNSGGPLINTQGRVIGINNFKISGGENLGFALESNYIEEITNKISEEFLNQTII